MVPSTIEPVATVIEEVKQRYHKSAFAFLARMGDKVQELSDAHALRTPKAFLLHRLFTRFSRDFITHMKLEEEHIFPEVIALLRTRLNQAHSQIGDKAAREISTLMLEDKIVECELDRLIEVAQELATTTGNSDYQRLTEELVAFRAECLSHIQLEATKIFAIVAR